MRIPRRNVFKGLAASLGLMAAGKVAGAADAAPAKPSEAAHHESGPDPLYEKPIPIKVAELEARTEAGVQRLR